MTEPLTRAQLEEKCDGFNAVIADVEESMAALRTECRRMLTKRRRCFLRGNLYMYRRYTSDAEFYLVQWKLANRRHNIIRSDRAALLNGTRVLDQIAQVMEEKVED